MQLAGPVAVLASNGQLGEWRVVILALPPRNGLRASGMADDACLVNGTAESLACLPEAGREIPRLRGRIVRQRSLKKMIAPANGKTDAILAGPDGVLKLMHGLENGF